MNNIDKLLDLLCKEDLLYAKVLQGNNDVLNEIDGLIMELLLNINDEKERDELTTMIIMAFSDKINIIYKLLNLNEKKDVTMDSVRENFKILEAKRFNVVNNFVLGIVKIEEIDKFRTFLNDFRKMLYAIPISDNNILEIAKMKSKVQHYDTEVLEDEEVLKCAYSNIS